MSVASRARKVTRRGEAAAESLMVDSCVITRMVTVTDPEDFSTSTKPSVVYEGRCKVQTYEPDAIDRVSAGRPVVTQEYRLHVPVGAGPFEIGDVAEVEGYPQPFRIDGLLKKTFQTAQRLKVTAQANAKGK